MNKCVFKCRLKDGKDDNCLIVIGRLFHARGPATEKHVRQLLFFFDVHLIDHPMTIGVLTSVHADWHTELLQVARSFIVERFVHHHT